MERRPGWLCIQRVIEKFLDPGGKQVFSCPVPAGVHGPGAPGDRARPWRRVGAHLDFARNRAALDWRMIAYERCTPGPRGWRLDLGEPEIRRPTVALSRLRDHA